MKKNIISVFAGVTLLMATAAYAGNNVQAVLFPVRYIFNGVEKVLNPEYVPLSYNEHSYVPIRFITENTDDAVVYDDTSKTISITEGFPIRNTESGIKAGKIKLEHTDGKPMVSGQMYVPDTYWNTIKNDGHNYDWLNLSKVSVSTELSFFDDQGNLLGVSSVQTDFTPFKDEIRPFRASVDRAFENYAVAVLDKLGPMPHHVPLPPTLSYYDETRRLAIGDIKAEKIGDYSKIHGSIHVEVPGGYNMHATIEFLGENGETLGSAPLDMKIYGDDPISHARGIGSFLAVARGDVSAFKSIRLTLDKLAAVAP